MAKIKPYESIIEQLQREYGESYQTNFSNDRASFARFSNQEPLTDMQQNQFSLPVGGRTRERLSAGDEEQFSDENTQLSIKASSTIQAAAYWKDRQYLVVSFKSGGSYSYTDVPVGVVQRWERATSAGSYFYYNIRTSYGYQKLG